MATISLAKVGATHPTRAMNMVPYKAEIDIDFAKAAEAKGSALASADVIEAISVPAGSYVFFAGAQVMEEVTGTTTDLTIDIGITGGNVDEYVDGFDLDAAVAGAWVTEASTAHDGMRVATADTIDILIATQTGTLTGGKLRVYAYILDLTATPTPGIAQLGS